MSTPLADDILSILQRRTASPGQLLSLLLDTHPGLTRAMVATALAELERAGRVTERWAGIWCVRTL
jgi:hypothetical protein